MTTTTTKRLTRSAYHDGQFSDEWPTDRDVPALTEAEEDELRAAWWHEQMMAEELDEVMEEAA